MLDQQRTHGADSFGLIALLWANRRIILFITFLGLVAGVVASFLITPRFTSEVVMFPAISNTPSKALFNEGASMYADMMAFGEEEDAQHLMQVLLSDRIRDRIAERFHLMDVYGIKPEDPHKRTELAEAYKDHVRIEMTKFGTVRVRVDDVDTVWGEMVRQRTQRAYDLVLREVRNQERVVKQMDDSLSRLRELGVHDYHTQSERFAQSLGEAIVRGDQRAVQAMDERLKGLANLGGPYTVITDELTIEIWRLGMWRTRLAQAEADLHTDIPFKFVLERALPYDKKTYPVRWLVTFICTLSALMFALLLVVVRERLIKLSAQHGQ
jgi:uncharacterized protein involved in exopolysaccharide biosynthesis